MKQTVEAIIDSIAATTIYYYLGDNSTRYENPT